MKRAPDYETVRLQLLVEVLKLDLPDLSVLQVRCDGVFPLTAWINFTDLDPASPAYRGSFCVQAVIDDPARPVSLSLQKIRTERDRKRAEFSTANEREAR